MIRLLYIYGNETGDAGAVGDCSFFPPISNFDTFNGAQFFV